MAAPFQLSVLTAEGSLFEGQSDFVVLPASEGELGILIHHSPVVALLRPGAVRAHLGEEEHLFFVSGGFVDVAQARGGTVVTVLADSGERATDIDEARAEEARKRAQEALAQRTSTEDYADAAAALERSVARIRVAETHRRRRSGERSYRA